MGVFIPRAESHRMRLGADFLTLIFPADDYWDSRFAPGQRETAVQWPVRLARLLDDPSAGLSSGHPCTPAFADLFARMLRESSPSQYRRFAEAFKTYFTGISWEFASLDGLIHNSLADAAACRIYSSGVAPTIALIEMTHDLHVPDQVFLDLPLRAYNEAAVFVIACHNDIFSFPKENADGSDSVNMVKALMAERRCSIAEATERMANYANQVMNYLIQLREQLRTGADAELSAYLDAVLQMVAGHLEFERYCLRYVDADQLPDFETTTTLPADTPEGLPPIPTFRWWTDQLRPRP